MEEELATGSHHSVAAAAVLLPTILTLRAAQARTEVLAEYVPPRRKLGIPRPATMRVLGRVWRLGVLLLAEDGTLYAVGETLRVMDPGTRSTPSRTAEVRKALREAARRARIAEGETVNHGAFRIDLDAVDADTAPLALRDGLVHVRWNPVGAPGALVPLASYLSERIDLLVHPPQGAS